jgi:hypothetical protein
MADRVTSNPVQENSGGGGLEEGNHPIAKRARETSTLEEINNVFPSNRVEGLANVEFEEKRRSPVFM